MVDSLTWSGVIADPVVQAGTLAVVGAVVTRIALRPFPSWKLAGQVFFFAALTVLLLYHDIVPYEVGPTPASTFERVFIALAKVVWWINAAWALIAFVRVFLIFERQPREGRLVQDLVIGLIYLGAILSVVAYVFSFPVGTLIATSGVLAIILGLAMQSTLSDVFSGIALNLGRPYAIGDWIVLNDGVEGRVVETNWRSTHLLNGSNDLVVLPNSFLAKVGLTNLSSPDRSHGATLTVRVVPTIGPSAIIDVMRAVLLSSDSILAEPKPGVQIKSLTSDAVELELSFRVKDIGQAGPAKNEIFDLLYRHVKAAGLTLARPLDAAGPPPEQLQQEEMAKPHRPTPLKLLDAVPLFSSLTEDEKETLAASMTRRTFKKDAILIEQGDTVASLMIVRSGALIATRQEGHKDVELGRLAPGDYFGESGLLIGVGEAASLRALTFVVVYEIAQASLMPLLHDRPGIAEELAATLLHRIETGQHSFAVEGATLHGRSVSSLVTRIRHLFKVPQ
ncbi:mechanosensitive ion channel family protein [Rhizobium leguminosarum]|uniref:mechanosensitive ion channel family protein n=1 Tax=Rhizobium leguminosarum TaxID=384 RepID=UPI001C97AD1F|nr:mechanosensitive ion channel family protein [Rhizobium leguminosarum]MBY5710563.1 mechanosensitive ion channel [Rhizobium leguminosarum]